MSVNAERNIVIPPPSDKRFEIKDKLSLVFEIVCLIILLVPNIVLAIFRRFLTPGKSLKGQVALVTGAGRGIGRGVAVALAREGCKVAVADVNLESAKNTVQEICKEGGEAKAYCTNVAKIQDVRQLRHDVTKDFGHVDLLVNNAAFIYFESIDKYPEEAVTTIVNVNLISHFWMAKEFLPAMRERNSGHIIAINSSSAFRGLGNNSAYVATRFGIRGLMDSLREELNSSPGNKIKVTSVYPYFTNTSALYTNQWDLRMPPLPVDEVAKSTITAIRREDENVSIPWILTYVLHLTWFFPKYIYDLGHHIIYTRIAVPSKEINERILQNAMINDVAKESF